MSKGSYQELHVWKKAHQLTLDIYNVTNDFPKNEIFGIISQLRRAIVSVELNIVEGKNRKGENDLFSFYTYLEPQTKRCIA